MDSQFIFKGVSVGTGETIIGHYCKLFVDDVLKPHLQTIERDAKGTTNIKYKEILGEPVLRSTTYLDATDKPIFDSDILKLRKDLFIERLRLCTLKPEEEIRAIEDDAVNYLYVYLSISGTRVYVDDGLYGYYSYSDLPLDEAVVIGNKFDRGKNSFTPSSVFNKNK